MEKKTTEYEKILEGFHLIAEGIVGIFTNVINTYSNVINDSINAIVLTRKITKKKFKKLLQSKGIQRNEINILLQNNKEQYTIARFIKIVNEI